MGKTAEQIYSNSHRFLKHEALRVKLFGPKDPRFLNSHNYITAFDREEISMGPSKTNVRMFTVDTNGILKEKRHAPRLKDFVIALGQDDIATIFYAKDGQSVSTSRLEQTATESSGQNLKALIEGRIYPKQERWEHALHMISIVDPAELVDFTLAQRLLHALSAERLEVVNSLFLTGKIIEFATVIKTKGGI